MDKAGPEGSGFICCFKSRYSKIFFLPSIALYIVTIYIYVVTIYNWRNSDV
ncbi:hypothetical protein M2277_003278 [Paenibacillus sp. LBL]|nr:hypothetical protein [Paenibacillus sp. LBL]